LLTAYLRKVFKAFAYHRKLTLKYNLLRVSARQGLTAILLKQQNLASNLGLATPRCCSFQQL